MEDPLSYSADYDLVPDAIAMTSTPLSMKTLSKRRTVERQSTAIDDMEEIDCSLPYVMPHVGFQSVTLSLQASSTTEEAMRTSLELPKRARGCRGSGPKSKRGLGKSGEGQQHVKSTHFIEDDVLLTSMGELSSSQLPCTPADGMSSDIIFWTCIR